MVGCRARDDDADDVKSDLPQRPQRAARAVPRRPIHADDEDTGVDAARQIDCVANRSKGRCIDQNRVDTAPSLGEGLQHAVAREHGVWIRYHASGRQHFERRVRAAQRGKVLVLAPIAALVAVGVLAVAAPRVLTTAQERLLSIAQHSSDISVKYRIVESRFVLDRIRAHPVEGSGLAATIFWGQPWAQGPAQDLPLCA